MEEYEITCAEQDFFGNISRVKVVDMLLQAATIIHWIHVKRYQFYIMKNGEKIPVHAKRNAWYGWFLTSNLSDEKANNLEFLCEC